MKKFYKKLISAAVKTKDFVDWLRKKRRSACTTEDLLNRKPYAFNAAEDIIENHNKNKRESYIFAISGKWGTGKTTILEFLANKLEDNGFKVILFSPWNYAQEHISLKRSFLKKVAKDLGVRKNLDTLYEDSTFVKINWLKLFLVVLFVPTVILFCWFFFAGYVIYTNRSSLPNYIVTLPTISLFLQEIQRIFTVIVLDETIKSLIFPILLLLIGGLLTINKNSPRISSTDEFQEKFDSIIGKRKKIVIFIDDLDRCTPEVVKEILDALATFFKNPRCSYVITGDHTVIEKYVGSKLFVTPEYKENGEKDEKISLMREIDEGRRFLKKLFNVYWQIPAAEPVRFREYIQKTIQNSKIANLTETDENLVVNLIDSFLEHNPRAVVRFIKAIKFNLDTISEMIDEKTQAISRITDQELVLESNIELEGLKEVSGQPALLAKTLLIQELFYNLYKFLVRDPTLLHKHETDIRRNSGKVAVLPGQDVFLHEDDEKTYYDLLKTSPKFTDDNDDTVKYNADRFLYLSGFTGLPSEVGPNESTFISILTTANAGEQLIKGLKAASKHKQEKLFELSTNRIFSSKEDPERATVMMNIIKVTKQVPTWLPALNTIIEHIEKNPQVLDMFEEVAKKDFVQNVTEVALVSQQNVQNVFTKAPWNQDQYDGQKWAALSIVEGNISSTTQNYYSALFTKELSTNEGEALAHYQLISSKTDKKDEQCSAILARIISQIVIKMFEKDAAGDVDLRKPFLEYLVSNDIEKLGCESLLASFEGAFGKDGYESEVKYFLQNYTTFSSYLSETQLKQLREKIIDEIIVEEYPNYMSAIKITAHFNEFKPEEIQKLESTFLSNTAEVRDDVIIDYLSDPTLKKIFSNRQLFNRLTSMTPVVDEAKRLKILGILMRENWTNLSAIDSQDVDTLRQLYIRGHPTLDTANNAKAVLKSWNVILYPKRKANPVITQVSRSTMN